MAVWALIMVYNTFIAEESITGGSVNIDLKIDSIIHYKKTLDLCEFASENRIQCPIPDMATAVKVTQTLPDVSVSIISSLCMYVSVCRHVYLCVCSCV